VLVFFCPLTVKWHWHWRDPARVAVATWLGGQATGSGA